MKKLTAIVLFICILTVSALSLSAEGLTLTSPEAGPLSAACQQVLVRGVAPAGKPVVVYVGGEYAGSVTAGKSGAYLMAVELTEGENLLSVSCEGQTLYRTVDFTLEGIQVETTAYKVADEAPAAEPELGFFQKLFQLFRSWFQ